MYNSNCMSLPSEKGQNYFWQITHQLLDDIILMFLEYNIKNIQQSNLTANEKKIEFCVVNIYCS